MASLPIIALSQEESLNIILNSNVNDTVKFQQIDELLSDEKINLDIKLKLNKKFEDFAISKNKQFLIAEAYFLTATTYYYLSDYEKAVENFYKALTISEELELIKLNSSIYNYLGIINSDQGNSRKAIYFFKKSYAISVKTKDISQQFVSASNLGVDYNDIGLNALALKYMEISENIAKKNHAYRYLPQLYGNKLICYVQLNDTKNVKKQFDSLNFYFKKIKPTPEEIISVNYFSGYYYKFIADYKKAISLFEKNLTINEPHKLQERKKNYSNLEECYFAVNDLKNAYKMLKQTQICSDSISNSEKIQKSNESENKFKNLKIEEELDFEKLNNVNNSLQLKRNKAVLTLVSSLTILLIIGIFIFYRLYKDKQTANFLLEKQKSEINHQKNEILDSIHYSKRIQEGILPSENELNQKVGEHFVFYKPKDIVSGDFYWASKKNEDTFLLACCDCTGHGVPGAFMSLVAYSLLNKIDEGNFNKKPSEVLDYLNHELPRFFKRENPSQKISDGLDMSLIEIDRKQLKLKFSGAKNSIYLIRENKIQVIKADRQPISADDETRKHNFNTIDVELKTGDLIIMYTDGYLDQFSGHQNQLTDNIFRREKFMNRRFEELLLINCNSNLKILKEKLELALKEWQGEAKQIDDVCVLGIRI